MDEKDIGLKIRDMVANGKLTREEAREKFVAWKAKAAMPDFQRATLYDEKAMAMGWKIREMVAKGIITPEEARAKWAIWQANEAKDKDDDEAAPGEAAAAELPAEAEEKAEPEEQ